MHEYATCSLKLDNKKTSYKNESDVRQSYALYLHKSKHYLYRKICRLSNMELQL